MTAKERRYLEWLREQQCARCNAEPSEAAHVRGPISAKTGGVLPRRKNEAIGYAIPLCASCHREAGDSLHSTGEETFFDRMGVDRHQLVATYHVRYLHEGGR